MILKFFSLLQKILLSPRGFLRYMIWYFKKYRRNDLIQFASEEGTDKGVPGHDYVRVYDAFLREKRKEELVLCEIGLLLGRFRGATLEHTHPEAPSLKMWRKYLPFAQLVGFDIRKFARPKDKKCIILQGDQSSRDDLKKILNIHKCYDVIIDDALHASSHQQITFSYLFNSLNSGGMFFIEDLRHQPEGFEKKDVPKTLDLLRELQVMGRWNSPLATSEEKKFLEDNVSSVHIFESLKGDDPKAGEGAIAVVLKK